MGKYGFRIQNLQAASIYECNLGVRENLDAKPAMLTNSLFLDFLVENGLSTWKDESTRDVICLEFTYGSRSYDDEMKHLKKMLAETEPEDTDRINHINELIATATLRCNQYDKKSKAELREIFYRDGVNVTYNTFVRGEGRKKGETVHYQMLYRTPGKAKKGTCMFICDRLFQKARDFLYMGIKLPEESAPIVEIGAYSSLITSAIVGRIQILPENILILKDFDSFMTTNVVSIETNERRECIAVRREGYQLKNTMFDGQALIDSSIFPTWGDGYILLRHHMTKCAAFCTHIQKFFKDYFGDGYDMATVTDVFGNEHRAKDIVMITTTEAAKWLKFDVSYEYWCSWVHKNDCLFGIVKTAHQSKLGDMQKMSYQMVNSLDADTIDDLTAVTTAYIQRLQNDDDAFLAYLEKNINFSNDYEVLIALVNQNRNFLRCDYFRERKKKIINNYVLNVRTGKLLQNADNLTIVGSPYALLLRSVGEDPESDPTFEHEDGCIQCWTERFDDGEYLAEFRNPFNSRNNLGYLHNHFHPYFKTYFNFGKLIIAVNMIHTDFQDRNNGSDMDSDSIYTTNQPSVVEHAKYCYAEYPTIVNNIPKDKNHYSSRLEDYALVDNKLAKAQLAIGSSSNLAQIALTYTYNSEDTFYDDAVCILSVLAQAAIDSTKRATLCDIPSEIKRLKKALDIDTNLYPEFWQIIRPEFNATKKVGGKTVRMVNTDLDCPMNRLFHYRTPKPERSEESTLPISEFYNHFEIRTDRKRSKKVEELIQKYSIDLYKYNVDDENNEEEYLLLRSDFEELIEDIRCTYISNNYLPLISWLVNRAFMITPNIQGKQYELRSTLNKNRPLLLKTLYDVSPRQLLQVFSKNCDNSGQQPEFDGK